MFTLEICSATLSSALAAQAAGAHRIELCSGLGVGGLTPSLGLLQAVRVCVSLPIYVLIRPREGHFCYSEGELSVMLRDIDLCRNAGADGVVVGALDAQGRPHERYLRRLAATASGMGLTFHRAFDLVPTIDDALEMLIALGFERVLTSGQAPSAYEGRNRLRQLVEQAAGRITIMPGGGISAHNIRALAEATGAVEFHLSARAHVPAPYAAQASLPGLTQEHWESDAQHIREVWKRLQPTN
ncbi:MAG: copper homeostasis protein CutC [Saprospiraceae bacterium]|nr:hypothetical protein [Saprospiraceae bacterium]MDW8229081.1 copper homeostasis protein CutC [Saprospiraceae bacterium]